LVLICSRPGNGLGPSDALDDKANRLFAGKVVRKDLVRKVKTGANVPVFVLRMRELPPG
jgi:ATP-dependent Lon protease